MTSAANQELSAESFALQLRPAVAKHLAGVIPKVLDFLKKALTSGQSFVMGINRYGQSEVGAAGSNFPSFDVVSTGSFRMQ